MGGAARVALAVREDMLTRAPDSALNGGLGATRTLLGYRAPLGELRAARPQEGGTLNDVGLAVLAGALRGLALEQGEPARPLKAMIPVDVRQAHEHAGLGNRLSLAAVWLPLHLTSAAARLAWVGAQTKRFKREGRPAGTQAVLSGAGLVPQPVRGAIVRAGASRQAFNLTVSNLSGPPQPLYMLGARLEEVYPVIPIAEGHRLSVGMLSYCDHLHFGLSADPHALPQVARLPDLLDGEVRALADGGRRNGASAHRNRSGVLAVAASAPDTPR